MDGNQLIVVILVVGLCIGGAVGYYVGTQPIQAMQATITQQGTQILSLTTEKTQLNTQVTNLQQQVSKLLADKNSLTSQLSEVNSKIQSQNEAINIMLLRLNDKYNVSGVNGVYLMGYKMTYGLVGMAQTYTADITLYNALSTATVKVKVYGSDSVEFTYKIPTGATIHKVETWTGDIWSRNYNYIVIEEVTR